MPYIRRSALSSGINSVSHLGETYQASHRDLSNLIAIQKIRENVRRDWTAGPGVHEAGDRPDGRGSVGGGGQVAALLLAQAQLRNGGGPQEGPGAPGPHQQEGQGQPQHQPARRGTPDSISGTASTTSKY